FWLRDLVKKASFEVITLISLIFILPIFFIIQAPIIINQDIALLIFSISIIINSYYLLKDNIHFITLHLILLNALVFLLITNQTKFLIHLIIIKVFLNIIIIYIIKNKSESKTLLALATFLSFGFPGLSIPLISIIKSWPISHISIVIFVLLTSFIINLIKIIKTFEFTGFKKTNYKTILILILIFLSIGISLKPEIIYNRLDYKIQENINE
ncbi:MAG: hypothetical protein PHT84_04840, partial [Candidatus Pacebacteria bacterium]|nr:hypothetical protein [Candidatus Paceibacterota bacterium]